MSKHAPGPWRTQPWPHERECMGADLGAMAVVGADGISPAVVWGGLESSEANARLIAAAPDLLEALKYARMYVETEGPEDELEMVDAAIAKAEGR